MESLYTGCAIVGGVLAVGQAILAVIGLGEAELDFDGIDADIDVGLDVDLDVDGDVDVGSADGDARFVGLLSTRAIVAAVAVFGMSGMAFRTHLTPLQTVLGAIGAGIGTMYLVAWVIRMMHKLAADGTVYIEHAVGQTGTVYLSIPANNAGPGKVTVRLRDRTMEYQAMTSGPKIRTGMPVVVTGIVNSEMLEVRPQEATETMTAGSGAV